MSIVSDIRRVIASILATEAEYQRLAEIERRRGRIVVKKDWPATGGWRLRDTADQRTLATGHAPLASAAEAQATDRAMARHPRWLDEASLDSQASDTTYDPSVNDVDLDDWAVEHIYSFVDANLDHARQVLNTPIANEYDLLDLMGFDRYDVNEYRQQQPRRDNPVAGRFHCRWSPLQATAGIPRHAQCHSGSGAPAIAALWVGGYGRPSP